MIGQYRPLSSLAVASMALALASLPSLARSSPASEREPLVGLPCEGCEAAFEGLPATVPTGLVLRGADTPGIPMQVDGRIVDAAGTPQPGVIIYLHQTDGSGVYPPHVDPPRGLGPNARRHGQLRGWLRSDELGRFRLDTVRPGAYPGRDIPEHIHMQVIEPGCATYLIDDLMFRDDPKLTPEHERRLAPGAGGQAVVVPVRNDAGWQAQRKIVLGEGVPGYPDCGRGR